MNAVGQTSKRDCRSLGHRIADLKADRIDIPIASYYGTGAASSLSFGGSFPVCFLILWIGLLFVGRERMLRDPGTLWHTVVGERMLENRQWITTDPFSFTFKGRPWIAQQWLAECAMALVHRAAGLDGLLLGAVTLLAVTFAWLYGRLRRAGLRTPIAVVLLALAIAASSYHFHPRPHLATIALAAWTLGLFADVEAGRRSTRWLFVLPPVIVLWTNLHGGALAGVATTVLVLFAWAMSSIWQRGGSGTAKPALSPTLCITLAILSGLAMLVNPYGIEMVKVWLALGTSKVLPKVISEHGPVALGSIEGVALASVAAAYLFFLAGCFGRGIRATWLIPLLWLPLAFMRVRHGPLFAVTSAVAIAEMARVTRSMAWLARWGQPMMGAPPAGRASPMAIALCSVVVAVSFLLESMDIRIPVVGGGWARLDTNYWPIGATRVAHAYMDEHPSHDRIFNDMLFGGYLISELPQAKVYIDDRCELYGDYFLLHYIEILRSPRQIEQELAVRQIDLVLVKPNSRIAAYLTASDDWRPLFKDAAAALFAKRLPASQVAGPLAEKLLPRQ